MGSTRWSLCLVTTIVLWLAINVADAWWIYYYVQTSVFPVPHTVLNRKSSAWTGFYVMMFIFGFVWSIVNVGAGYGFVCLIAENDRRRTRGEKWAWLIFCVFIGLPIFLFLAIMPFAGGWIVKAAVKKHVWNHGCDDYPMFALLDGRSYNDPSYVVNRAYFYSNTPSSSPKHLFTFSSTNPLDGDEWLFALRNWDTPQSSIPEAMYPTLQHVWYNFADLSHNGTCTLRNSSDANANTTELPCMHGSFDPGHNLFFNVTSAVPLNSTLAPDADTVPSATTFLGIPDNSWDEDSAPALKLQQRDPDTGDLGHLVLKTTVTRPNDCTELKVCIAGPEGRQGGTVSAEVLAPLGLMLMRQADYAKVCSQPSDP